MVYSQRALPPKGLSPQSMVPRNVRLSASYDAASKCFRAGGAEPSSSLHSDGADS
eukprot:CAMPEP_0206157432 /NCGR_PEP_ID=MMETSP1474-20131121/3902_1 /ASSEMBLY_ACC=CAM_ASM_001110 /TAXON_ID=97495 /ORGANISM="Imantonia sp., Strain RCC918" /LENGTH=54 /DNA_ID=CAMNT_0053556995 /DNA_START=246 /DNA_END=410 /DNA_ORIENTATION=+